LQHPLNFWVRRDESKKDLAVTGTVPAERNSNGIHTRAARIGNWGYKTTEVSDAKTRQNLPCFPVSDAHVRAEVTAQVVQSSGTATASETETGALPEPLSPEAVREMVARMSDDQVRAMLLDRLDVVASSGAPAAGEYVKSVAQIASETWAAFYAPLVTAVFGLPDILWTGSTTAACLNPSEISHPPNPCKLLRRSGKIRHGSVTKTN